MKCSSILFSWQMCTLSVNSVLPTSQLHRCSIIRCKRRTRMLSIDGSRPFWTNGSLNAGRSFLRFLPRGSVASYDSSSAKTSLLNDRMSLNVSRTTYPWTGAPVATGRYCRNNSGHNNKPGAGTNTRTTAHWLRFSCEWIGTRRIVHTMNRHHSSLEASGSLNEDVVAVSAEK